MSQKLSGLLIILGLAWGLMLLRYTVQQPRHKSSGELRQQILELSRRYVKVLNEENQNTLGGPQGPSMAGYGKGCFRENLKLHFSLVMALEMKGTANLLLEQKWIVLFFSLALSFSHTHTQLI